MSGLCTHWVELWQGTLSLQTLLMTKGNTPEYHARLPSGWRMRGCQEDFASDFLFILGQDCSLSFPPAFGSRGGGSNRDSGNPPTWEMKMAACHACPFSVWATGSGLGSSFPLFLGVFHTKTVAGMRSAYSMLAFAMPASPAWFWGSPTSARSPS